jgi:hypothetical protein
MRLFLATAVAAAALLCLFPVAVDAKNQRKQPPYPADFKLEDALSYYSEESNSLLKRAMLSAGFRAGDTDEWESAYLDFATRALTAEKKRIEQIRDALKEKLKVVASATEEEQTCSDKDGECVDKEASDASKKKDDKLDPEMGHFLVCVFNILFLVHRVYYRTCL